MSTGTTVSLLAPPPAPLITLESAPYWDAAKDQSLLVKRCDDCNQPHFYPRDICPHCLSTRTRWVEASGNATLYSFSRTLTKEGEYVLAYVRLEEGVTLMTNLVDYVPGNLKVDMPLSVVFVPTADGKYAVPMFRPAEAQ